MLTIVEARHEIDAGRISAVELVEDALGAIDRRQELNAYLRVDREGAIEAARAAERDGDGPLAGIPICVKDVLDVAGMPTTAGASGWSRHPASDALTVARLRRAGAVIVGKGNTNEFAFGIDGRNPHWGDCRNPHDPARMTAGSTSGPAAATAAGLALAGIGTDTSGSLRAPASLCGLVAIRPTHGLVPTQGVVPLAPSYDTVGPIARTVADVSILFDVIAGDAGGPAPAQGSDDLRGVRIGVLEQFLGERCSRVVADAVRGAADLLRSAGAEVEPVELPGLDDVDDMHRTIQYSEAAASHSPWFEDQRPRYAPDVLDRLERGAAVLARDYLLAQRKLALLREQAASAFSALDAALAPATPVAAPRRDAQDVDIDGRSVPVRAALLSFTVPLTQPGGPVVAVPLGDDGGLPFGLQIIGRPHSDREVLRIAAAYRRLAGFGVPEP
jgi:aspartyl-tRNA(Asn)/glutamyl-tRNA(Gln) amidotransferase subunit A